MNLFGGGKTYMSMIDYQQVELKIAHLYGSKILPPKTTWRIRLWRKIKSILRR